MKNRMILEFKERINKKEKSVKGSLKELMQNLYKRNLSLIKSYYPNIPVYQNDRIIKAKIDIGYIFMSPFMKSTKPISFIECEKEQLRVYPHGRYATYLPLAEACQFQDELRQMFPYFKQFEQKSLSNNRLLRYNTLTNALVKIDQNPNISDMQKKIEFSKCWQRFVKKYMCDLDLNKRMLIYLEVLKEGTGALARHYKQLFQEGKQDKCQFDVFVKAVMSCQKHFGVGKKEIDSIINSFSIETGDDINEVSMGKTLKMLYCSLCNIYDCGRHEDDNINFNFNYHFAAPANLFSQTQLIDSALRLLKDYEVIFNSDIELVFTQCSDRCYYNLAKNKQANYLNQKRNKACYSPAIRGLVKMGIQMFMFDPCLIWSLMNNDGQKINITCDMVFLFLIEEYGLVKRLKQKLCDNEVQYLRKQSQFPRASTVRVYPIKKKSKMTKINHISKISVCHHYFVGQDPFDLNCSDCVCKNRGYCLKQCLCTSKCPLRRGCECKNQSQCYNAKCSCYKNSWECQPGLCKNCFQCDYLKKRNKCRNNAIQQKQLVLLRVGPSTIKNAGLGLFAGENIANKQFVCTYTGQIIETEVEGIRESITLAKDFYNFGSHEGCSVDSRFMGNKSRFINHGNSGSDNLTAEIKHTNETHVISFYATKNIAKDQELFFNYDGSGQLFDLHRNKYPFIKG